jgi:hypothetical protein
MASSFERVATDEPMEASALNPGSRTSPDIDRDIGDLVRLARECYLAPSRGKRWSSRLLPQVYTIIIVTETKNHRRRRRYSSVHMCPAATHPREPCRTGTHHQSPAGRRRHRVRSLAGGERLRINVLRA